MTPWADTHWDGMSYDDFLAIVADEHGSPTLADRIWRDPANRDLGRFLLTEAEVRAALRRSPLGRVWDWITR